MTLQFSCHQPGRPDDSTAYGFSAKKDLLQQLLDLNLAVASRVERGEPVTAPGIPPDFPTHESLVTDDCIRPRV